MPNLSQLVTDLEAQRKQAKDDLARLDAAIATLRKLNGSSTSSGAARRGRRRLSAAARKRIADAQKARWAKWKQQHKKAA
jgi:hypothetical protein